MLTIQKTFNNNWPTLYVIGTPIGNLQDISKRAIEYLNKCDFIYCEDSRVSLQLLNNLNISKKLKPIHKFNESLMLETVENDFQQFKNLALISDAGIPCISDPGSLLINNLLSKNIKVNICPINCGPAYIHAIVGSGFLAKNNLFLGFINKKNFKIQLINILNNVKNSNTLISFYESVHRIKATICQLSLILKEDVKIVVAREITKINEEFIRGTIKEINEYFENSQLIVKGEYCIVINSIYELINSEKINFEKINLEFLSLLDQNICKKEAIKQIAKKYKIEKNELINKFYK